MRINELARSVMLAAPVVLMAAASEAQPHSVVGTWSTATTNTLGQVTGTIFTTFNADGRFTQRWVVPRGTVDYSGSYTLQPDGTSLQWVYRDFTPKQDCSLGACIPVVPMVQMNTPVVTPLRWERPTLFLTQDGGGTMRWVRQQ